MPGEDNFDAKNQLRVPKVVVKKETVHLEHHEGNGSFVKPSSSNTSPKTEGYLDSFDMARSSGLNANFNSGNVNPGPNAADIKPFATFALSAQGLVQINDNADIKTSMILASSPNTLSSGHVTRQNNSQGRKREDEPKTVSSVSQTAVGSRVSKKMKTQASASSPVERLNAQRLKEFQTCDPELRALIHHSRHQIQLDNRGPHFLPDLGVVQCKSIVKSLGQDFKRQVICPATRMAWVDDDVCLQRLSHFFNVMRNRPKDNNIVFWREFVSEFYAPSAKERWCFSPYTNIGRSLSHKPIVSFFRTCAVCHKEGLRCESCGANSVKGFDTKFEALPWLWKTRFDSGVTDELLHLDSAQEVKFTSGMRLLKYENVVQETVWDGIHVKRHGKLRLGFGRDLKILSWEFCANPHEEYVICCSAEKNQMGNATCPFHTFDNRATVEAAKREMLASRNMFQSARQQLARTMEQPTANDSRFSEVSVRSRQIGEVVDMMKDLMAFSTCRNTAPIESLQTYVHGINHNETQSAITEEHEERLREESFWGDLEGGNKFKAAIAGTQSHTASNANMAFSYSANVGVEPGSGNYQTGSARRPDESLLMSQNQIGYYQIGSARRPDESLLMNLNLNKIGYNQTGSGRSPDQSLLMNLNLNQTGYNQAGTGRNPDQPLLMNLNLNQTSYNQAGSDRRPDESLLRNPNLNLNRTNQVMASHFLSHRYGNQAQCGTSNLASAVSPELGQNSVQKALGKQKGKSVVDTSGNIVPGVPIRLGGTSVIRNVPNQSYPTSVVNQYNRLVNVLGNAGSPFATSCINSVNVQGSSSTMREESGNPDSYLPAACRGM